MYCPACGTKIPPDGTSCPQCGTQVTGIQLGQPTAQPKKRRRPLVIIGIVVGVMVVLCLCMSVFSTLAPRTDNSTTVAPVVERAEPVPQTDSGASNVETPESANTPKPTKPTPTAKPTATPLARMGDSVVLDGVTFRVISAENTGNMFRSEESSTPLETSGMFILLKVEITNTGKEPISLRTPILIDSAGREYSHHDDQVWHLPNDQLCVLETLNPGLTKTCANLFELPADATGIMAVLKSSLFGEGVKVSLE